MNEKMNQTEGALPGAKEQNSVEAVLAYHRRTKHHLDHYAASLGYLDWATQPDPFRTYVGAERVELPLLADGLDAAYAEIYFPGAVPAMPLERNSVAILFELALGLSAWKHSFGSVPSTANMSDFFRKGSGMPGRTLSRDVMPSFHGAMHRGPRRGTSTTSLRIHLSRSCSVR